MMRYWGVVFCFCLWGWGVQGQPEVALKQLLETPGLNHAAIGISVKKVGDGTTVLAHQAGMALTPASVTKLLPTVFALQERGKDFRFKTRVGYTGKIQDGTLTGDLILVAAGDPTLESRYFPNHSLLSPIVTALEKAGIQRIDGSIRVEGALPGVNIPGSWTWEDVSNYYAALYLPFNYRDNTCFYHFQTGVAGTPAKLKEIVPALPGVKIVNEVTAAVGNRDDAWVFGGPYSEVLCIRGTLPQNRTLFKVKGAIHRPAEVFVAELTDILKARGITVAKKKIEEQPRTEWLTLTSPELGEIVFHTNKASVPGSSGGLAGKGRNVTQRGWDTGGRNDLKRCLWVVADGCCAGFCFYRPVGLCRQSGRGDIGPFIAGGRKRRWFKWLLYRSDSIERTDAG